MLVIKVELHSALDGRVETLGVMSICNTGGSKKRGDYTAHVVRKGTKDFWDVLKKQARADVDAGYGALTNCGTDLVHGVTRRSGVENYPRLDLPVWHLVKRALENMGYT